ncbi:MAG: UvrD-helicase domain-containing protein [Oscillospiraceae bacterium]|nr:UvrD-helicase domain-containing protein [Oscillospiraceae bacterium]
MAEMTGEQRLAAELRGRNILVNAAAGSGKTKVLTERIIGIVSDKKDPADIDSLLVVTFTKAAAKEMRERISNEMTRMSLADTGNKHLKKQLILLNYADITTIDAFCLNVVKSNFHRLDLDSSFSVMSESEAAVICDEIMDEVFEENYIRSDNGGFLNLVDMYSKNHDDTSLKDMIRAVYKFASSMPDIDGELTRMEELYDKPFGENVRSGENRYTDSMYTEISLSLDVIITSYQRMTAAFSTYTDDIKTLKKMETMIAGELMFFTDLKDKADKRQWNEASKLYEAFSFGRASSWAGIDDWVKDLREKCKDDLKSLKAFFGCKKLDDAAERITGIYRPVVIEILKLTREFSRKYNEKKKSISKFEFSDIERMCLSLLRDENGKDSDICINFREKYREILIDEYQDSNRLQDEIFSAISNGKNMFTVGDMKQSIYAFRNCDPTLFKDKADKFGLVKPAEDSESGRVSEDAVGEDNDENDVSNGAKVILSKNFRSSSECINAVNEIFANIMSEKYGEIDYNDEQRLNIGNKNYDESQNIPGLLKAEIDIIERDCKDANIEKQYAGDGYDEDGEGDSEVDTEKIRIEARFAAQRIKELKRSGYKVLDKNTNSYRPLENRDIAVLLRAEKSNDNASIYADELNKCGINAYAQSAGYFDKPEIRTILSLLKVVNNPLNDIPLIAVMCSLLYGIPEEDIARIHIFNKSGHIYENIVDMLQKEN